MKTLSSCLCIFGVASVASAGATVLMDQIGLDDGSSIDTTNMFANQYFEAGFSQYNIAAVDDFTNGGGLSGSSMSVVMGGWNGYVSVDGVSALQANFYGDIADAGVDLVGYVSESVTGTPTADPNWNLANYDLVTVFASSVWAVGGGTQYCALIPTNEFGTNGQTGAALSYDGDGVAWQANPAGGFGFGPYQELAGNIALRVMGGSGDPCDLPLPSVCTADVSGPAGVPDGLVGVDDILMIIATFGEVGDGSSRPQGDCHPLPTGDCQVTVDDLLQCIGEYGSDCQPRGACCYGVDGCTEDVTEPECAGDWLGSGSSCASCVHGACCLPDASCVQATPDDCAGAYQGDGTDCDSVSCAEAPENDTCDNALPISDGDTGIDVTNAFTDGPDDFTEDVCTNFGNTQVYNDIWYVYEATCDGTASFSTCNQVDFDSRIALYDACGGTLLACNDDADGCGLTSNVTLAMTSGQMIYVRVGRYSEGSGTPSTGVLSVACEIPAEGACCVGTDCYDLLPADCDAFFGDYQGSGTDCATTECGTTNDTCETAASVDCNSTTSFDTSDATDSGYGEPDDTQCSGTYLDWGGSPDVWFKITTSDSGTMTVSLCDGASYDTSLVLYQGSDCGSLTQVACNGDSSGESGCQSYYSAIYDHPVNAGDTFYIRIGGWNAATGPGTMTITCVGAGATGACCTPDGGCTDGTTMDECAAASGLWNANMSCADTTCPEPAIACDGTGAGPTAIDGAWTAGTSDSGSGYLRASAIDAGSGVNNVTVYGLSLIYSGGWGLCSTPETMAVASYVQDADHNDLSGSSSGTFEATSVVYASTYPLSGYTNSHGGGGAGGAYLQTNSTSAGEGECWLLIMSSDFGTSQLNGGDGWADEAFGLNYCLD